MILLVGCEKGGTGKSTMATNLGVYLAHQSIPFALLDTDKQRTSSKWADRREELRKSNPDIPKVFCPEKRGEGVFQMARDLEAQFGIVIIDAGGRDSPELRFAMSAADILLTPLGPSQFDLETLEELSLVVQMARTHNPKLKAKIVISNADQARGRDEYMDARKALEDFPGFELSKNYISHLKVYRQASKDGLGVLEMKNSKARAEIQLLAQEIFQ